MPPPPGEVRHLHVVEERNADAPSIHGTLPVNDLAGGG
jgi:hypothetical protein